MRKHSNRETAIKIADRYTQGAAGISEYDLIDALEEMGGQKDGWFEGLVRSVAAEFNYDGYDPKIRIGAKACARAILAAMEGDPMRSM